MTKTTTILGLGFTGTFGHAFTKYTLKHNQDTHIRIFSRDEYKQGIMEEEFNHDPHLSFMLGDVRDRDRLNTAMKRVDVVIHAAALKQVPALEKNPIEAKKTNIDGTMNVVNAVVKAGVKKAILLSTDKAVHPINAYGVSKAMAERLWLTGGDIQRRNIGQFTVIRYGNVLGSRGSVVERWREQNKQVGTITITDPNMTRFLLTPERAVELVWIILDTNYYFHSTGLFVPILPTATVGNLATAIVPDAKQEIVGIRQGEKFHEELLSSEEVIQNVKMSLTPNDAAYWISRWSSPGNEETWAPYASNSDPDNHLTVEEIRKLLELE